MTATNKPILMGPPAVPETVQPVIQMINNYTSQLSPPLPIPRNYGQSKENRKKDERYVLALRDKPPIEYVAEFLCNIFSYCKKENSDEEGYFYDDMGRTFFETILHLFAFKGNNDNKINDLRKKFRYRARNQNGEYAVFNSNHVSNDEMRTLIPFFYNYFQKNDDMFFNYYEYHYYHRSRSNEPSPPVMYEFVKAG